jgi:hypothetical protein
MDGFLGANWLSVGSHEHGNESSVPYTKGNFFTGRKLSPS